jgi:WD40 repeat protein
MSTSNDGTVRVWSLDGDALAVVNVPPGRDGQPPFVYRSVALQGLGDGMEVVAVGEEAAAFVWRGQVGEPHPLESGFGVQCPRQDAASTSGSLDGMYQFKWQIMRVLTMTCRSL